MTSILARIEQALDSIRPYLETDGGNIQVISFEQGVLKVEFLGNCGECPMSNHTFRAGVQEAIRQAVPEVTSIEVINGVPVTK